MARMIEAANQFKNMPVEHITYDSTDRQLKVFLLSEFQYLIEETVNETKKYIWFFYVSAARVPATSLVAGPPFLLGNCICYEQNVYNPIKTCILNADLV